MVFLTEEKQKRRREVFLDVQNGHGVGLQLRESSHPTCTWAVPEALLFASCTDLMKLLAK